MGACRKLTQDEKQIAAVAAAARDVILRCLDHRQSCATEGITVAKELALKGAELNQGAQKIPGASPHVP